MANTQYLDPRMAQSRPYELTGKEKAIAAAQEMQAIVEREVKKAGVTDPQYVFLELIGKGAFGRVYKSKYAPTNQVVAVKIIDVDTADFRSRGEDTLKDVLRETGALRALKESHAKNINIIYDAFFLASYVWIVSEYCPGGSVRTLMRASPEPGLSESYIIPIARELAEALKWVHNAGIIHRDVKAANILICEDGRVQLCDFGVAGILETKLNKRTTILGTPHYMAPEILDVMEGPMTVEYGNEVDIWAFGCTLYELATGQPPNARVAHDHLRYIVQEQVPRLEGAKYSAGLRSLVEFCIEKSPSNRPSIEKVQSHHYIANTAKKYPTTTLRQLLYDYYVWERSGGQRASLFLPGGAPAPELVKEDEEEWNFSTTDVFDNSFTTPQPVAQPSLSRQNSIGLKGQSHPRIPLNPLERLFNPNDNYNYLERSHRANFISPSDLPLREQNENSSRRETLIDAGAFDASTGIATIPDLATIKGKQKFSRFLRDSDDESEDTVKFPTKNDDARRATKDWKFPTFITPDDAETAENPGTARRKTQDWKFPSFSDIEDSDKTDESQETRRKTRDWKFPVMTMSGEDSTTENSSTSASGALGPARPSLAHSRTEPIGIATSHPFVDRAEADKFVTSAHLSIDLDEYTAGPGLNHRSSFTQFMEDSDSPSLDADMDTPRFQPPFGPRTIVEPFEGVSDGDKASTSGPLLPDILRSRQNSVDSQVSDVDEEIRRNPNARLDNDRDKWQHWEDHLLSNSTGSIGSPSQEPIWEQYNQQNTKSNGRPLAGPLPEPMDSGNSDFQRSSGMPVNAPLMSSAPKRSGRPATGAGEHQLPESVKPHSPDSPQTSSDDEGEYDGILAAPFQLGPLPAPPSAAALLDTASTETVTYELTRMFEELRNSLGHLRVGLEANVAASQNRAARRAAERANRKATQKVTNGKGKGDEPGASGAEKSL